MPIYEYTCKKCGARAEFVEQLGRGRIVAKKCPSCGSPRLKKTVSSFSYHKEVTLEDLGVNVTHTPVPESPAPEMQGPPPGGCPYCSTDNETSGDDK